MEAPNFQAEESPAAFLRRLLLSEEASDADLADAALDGARTHPDGSYLVVSPSLIPNFVENYSQGFANIFPVFRSALGDTKAFPLTASGTGFVVDSQGRIVTCWSVVKDAEHIWVGLPDGSRQRCVTDSISERTYSAGERLVLLAPVTPTPTNSFGRPSNLESVLSAPEILTLFTCRSLEGQVFMEAIRVQPFRLPQQGQPGWDARVTIRDLDFAGCSGSPVINARGNFVGILVAGEQASDAWLFTIADQEEIVRLIEEGGAERTPDGLLTATGAYQFVASQESVSARNALCLLAQPNRRVWLVASIEQIGYVDSGPSAQDLKTLPLPRGSSSVVYLTAAADTLTLRDAEQKNLTIPFEPELFGGAENAVATVKAWLERVGFTVADSGLEQAPVFA